MNEPKRAKLGSRNSNGENNTTPSAFSTFATLTDNGGGTASANASVVPPSSRPAPAVLSHEIVDSFTVPGELSAWMYSQEREAEREREREREKKRGRRRRRKTQGEEKNSEKKNSKKGIVMTDHLFRVPLDYSRGPEAGTIQLFVRVATSPSRAAAAANAAAAAAAAATPATTKVTSSGGVPPAPTRRRRTLAPLPPGRPRIRGPSPNRGFLVAKSGSAQRLSRRFTRPEGHRPVVAARRGTRAGFWR